MCLQNKCVCLCVWGRMQHTHTHTHKVCDDLYLPSPYYSFEFKRTEE